MKKKTEKKCKLIYKSSGSYLIKTVVTRTSDLSLFIIGMNQLFFLLHITATGKWNSTGIVSYGYGCARPHKYGVYSNVAHLKGWIIETILNDFYKTRD